MKRIFSYIIIAMVATVVLVSCSSDDNPFPKMSDDLSIIYASTSSATRASINATPDASGNYDVVWDEGDHILIVDKDGNQKEYQLIEGKGTTNGKFKECDKSQTLTDGTFTAYYPVSSYDTTNKTFKWTVGSEKFSQSIGFTGVPMKATPTEHIENRQVPNFTFSNEAGIFKINIKANAYVAEAKVKIGKITVKVNDEDFASIASDDPGFLTEDGITYYLMMPYQTIPAGKCKFQIEDHKGRPFCMATSTGNVIIEQSKINSTNIEIAAEKNGNGYLCFHEYSNFAPCTVQLVPLDEEEDDGWKTAAGKVRNASRPKAADPNPKKLEYSYNLIKWYDYTGDPVEYDKLEHVFFRRKLTEGVATEFNTSTDKMRFKVVAGENAEGFYARTRVLGNVMSLIDGTCESVKIPNDYCFASLFRDNEYIHEVAYLYLPATTLTKGCYKNMFTDTKIGGYTLSTYTINSSTPIVAAPKDGILPESCYEEMFYLTTENEKTLDGVQFQDLDKVTKIGKSSCKNMFKGCTELKSPILYSAVGEVGENGCEGMYYNCDVVIPDDNLATLTKATSLSKECYKEMFYGCDLTKAPHLPATVLKEACYRGMFRNCTSLTTLPTISATTLDKDCCREMFYNCTSLTEIPNGYTLDATTLAENCYYTMFYYCTALKTVNTDLLQNATNLAEYCCYLMFGECATLQNAPNLPATTLAENCYYRMFYHCQALKEVPELNATTLASACYRGMFEGCTTLTCGTALPATITDDVAGCYTNMFKGCTNLVKLADGTYNKLPSEYVNNECYMSMFEGCTSLTDAPAISATTIGKSGCESMFSGCTSLKIAPTLDNVTSLGANGAHSNCKLMFKGCTALTSAQPKLNATTLTKSCYESMFQGCTSLVAGPELMATTYSSTNTPDCFKNMFNGCSSLSSVKVHFSGWYGGTTDWLKGVASSGTIYGPSSLNNNTYKGYSSYIPTGWEVNSTGF